MSNDEAEPVDAAEGGQVRASTLELFFDLVFVFTITQLAHVFGLHSGWPAFGRVVLMFEQNGPPNPLIRSRIT
ncbi:low temperature requirement protein A [Nocardia sp. GAS34]|uniref:low temperature requirement protein A n=1 Tax=unclassified Nocardia TaxID=2637762 RepID=UPI003D1DB785